MLDAAQKVIEKYEELESELASPDVIADQAKYTKLQKQYKGLEKSCLKAKEFVQLSSDLQEWKQVLAGNDPELSDAAKEEIPPIEKRIEELENELLCCDGCGKDFYGQVGFFASYERAASQSNLL